MLDYGQFYASQTFNNVANGRRIQIGWMNGPGPLPNMPFNQQMSVPCDLALIHGGEGFTILRLPVKEIESLRGQTTVDSVHSLASANQVLGNLKGGLYDVELTFRNERNTHIHIEIGGHDLAIDPMERQVSFEGKTAPLSIIDGKIKIELIIDRASVEIFLQDGAVCLTSYLPATNILPKDRKIDLRLNGYDTKIEHLRATELKSTW